MVTCATALGAEASGSPLTRSCSANYPVGACGVREGLQGVLTPSLPGSLLSKGSIMSVLGEAWASVT